MKSESCEKRELESRANERVQINYATLFLSQPHVDEIFLCSLKNRLQGHQNSVLQISAIQNETCKRFSFVY